MNEKLQDSFGKSITKRTIQDDIKFMIEHKQAPIEKRKEGTTTYFYYSDQSYSIKNLPVKEEEILLLNDALNILRQVNDFKILFDVDEIVNKLQNKINANIEKSSAIIQFEKHTVLGTGFIDDLFTAIKEHLPLRITYQPFTAHEATQVIFHPYLLKEYRNRWFLIGRDGDNKNVRNLALDRIKKIKNSDIPFIPNNLFDPETYFNNFIGVTILKGEEIQIIEIKVVAKLAPYIRTKPIHQTQEVIKECSNGEIIIKLNLIYNYELCSVLLGFGADIEVLKPVSLRENLKNVFKKGFDLYA